MAEFVVNRSGIRISIGRRAAGRGRAVIVAPGFFTSFETKTFRRMISDLSKSFDVIGMDFRGHGRSGGAYTFSARESEDLKAVVDFARGRYSKVGVLGFSYGGAIAILEAAEHRNVDSLACAGSPMAPEEIEFHWWKPEAFRLGVVKFEWGNGVRPGNPFLPKKRAIDALASLESPIFFLHGDIDPTVGARHSRLMHEAARGRKKLKIFENGSHAEDLYRKYPAEFISEITRWFVETL